MSILFAVILFSLLILVHELGHFAAAKLSGVRVNEFSMFMGPALVQKQLGETVYSIRLFPLGGYCAMEGEDEKSDDPRSFDRAAWWKRVIILVAGAAMNFLVGGLLMVIFCLPIQRQAVPVVTELESVCSAAGENGFQPGDRILKVDGEKIYVYSDINMILTLNGGESHDFLVERQGRKVALEDVPMVKYRNEEGGEVYGITFAVEDVTLSGRFLRAWNQTLDTVRMVRLSLKMLFTGQAGLKDMSGPVGIVQQMSQAADASASRTDAMLNLIYFGGFIAINLGIMNLLPIPALDGGRVVGLLVTTLVQAVTGKKVDPKYEMWLHGAGMILLLGLMALIMFKDIFFLFQ